MFECGTFLDSLYQTYNFFHFIGIANFSFPSTSDLYVLLHGSPSINVCDPVKQLEPLNLFLALARNSCFHAEELNSA